MNMFRAFMELGTIQESYNNFGDRQELIDKIKALGKRYYFNKYSNEQLFYIWQKESAKKAKQDAFRDYYDSKTEKPVCDECGYRLTDGGYCPICDDGAEDLEESIFDVNYVKSVATTQNINENTNKENFKMNFQTVLEELDKIYEELPAEETTEKEVEDSVVEEEVTEACDKTLTEDADEEVLIDDEPIIDDEVADEEAPAEDAQLVLECAKCGALVIKSDSDVKVDEETDLANVDEACQYCEEAEGYKILGNLVVSEAPVEEPKAEEVTDEEVVEESLEKNKENVSEETAAEETAKSTEE